MGVIKNRSDRQALQEAARIAGTVCDTLMAAAQPGVSSVELEAMANRLLQQNRSSAPFKRFEGFNHAICLSLNAEIVNGPPSPERVLQPGDLVSIAIGSCYRNMHAKAARTVYLGKPPEEVKRLLEGTGAVIPAMIEASQTTVSLREVLSVIPRVAEQYGLTLIDGAAGYGIGRELHDYPAIPNNPRDLTEDVLLVPGLAFTAMPMMSLGHNSAWELHEDGWTQVTADGALSAHFAETCMVTDAGLICLSRLP